MAVTMGTCALSCRNFGKPDASGDGMTWTSCWAYRECVRVVLMREKYFGVVYSCRWFASWWHVVLTMAVGALTWSNLGKPCASGDGTAWTSCWAYGEYTRGVPMSEKWFGGSCSRRWFSSWWYVKIKFVVQFGVL